MQSLLHSRTALAATVGAFALVAAIAPGSAAIRTVVPAHGGGMLRVNPDTCNTPVTYQINPAGGVFKLPSCGGTMGKVTYGPNNAPGSATVTLTTSTTNPAPSQCGSQSGEKTLAYVTVTSTGNGAVTYTATSKKSSLKNKAFKPSMTFTLYAYAFDIEQFAQPLGSPNNKGVLKFPSPLNGKTIPLGVPLCFELDTP